MNAGGPIGRIPIYLSIAFARLALRPEDEIERWTSVLDWGRAYNPGEEDVFLCGVVNLSLSSAYVKLGLFEEGIQHYEQATRILQKQVHQFLIPGIGTYLFRYAQAGPCNIFATSFRLRPG